MAVEFLGIDMWDLLINQIFGSFWLCILGLALAIFVIMAVVGRMSKISVINYILLFLMVFTSAYGIKWLTVVISGLLLYWVYSEIKASTSG